MHVTSREMEAPVALFEQWHTVQDERKCLRILFFRTGLLPATVLSLLGRLLSHI